MLQEQQQQLQQLLGGLADTLKVVTTRLDDQAGASRKAFADQKLLIDNVAEGVRVLREKADDTNVRLSTMTQELQCAAADHRVDAAPGDRWPQRDRCPRLEPIPAPCRRRARPARAGPASSAPPLISPQRMFDNAYSDYRAGQYDLAIRASRRSSELSRRPTRPTMRSCTSAMRTTRPARIPRGH